MEYLADIELKRHKAHIVSVRGVVADGIWRKVDYLSVLIDLDEAVDGTLGFGVEVPVEVGDYWSPGMAPREDFLRMVIREGERRLEEIVEKDKKERARHTLERERQRKLDDLSTDIERRLKEG